MPRPTLPQSTLLLALALSALPAMAQRSRPALSCDDRGSYNDRLENYCEMREQTFPRPSGAIQIDPGMNGGLSVSGWDRADMLVRARIQTAAPSASEAKTMTPQIRFASGGEHLVAEGPSFDHDHNWSVSYEIFVPRATDIQAKTHNGGIHFADLNGNLEFEALNGGVTLQRLAGYIQGHTTNGGLTVELAGDHWDGRGVDVETTNGGVRVNVPSNYSAKFETSTVNGGLDVDFPVAIQGRITKELSFSLGGGGATIRAVTTNGGVKIKRS